MRIKSSELNLLEKCSVFISSLSFVGFIPFAPGTFGSLLAFAFYNKIPDKEFLILIISVFFVAGVFFSSILDKKFEKDPSFIVIDEIVGMLIPFLVLPNDIVLLAIAFVLFRFFDIVKPLGINKLQSLKSGFGVMMDDVLAGIYTLIIMKIILTLRDI